LRLKRELETNLSRSASVPANETLHQPRNILSAVAQGWNLERKHVEAIE